MIRSEMPQEALLRPIGEFYVIITCLTAISLIFFAHEYLYMSNTLAYVSICALSFLTYLYICDAYKVWRYQSNIRVLRPYVVNSNNIPFDPSYVELGKGFKWEAIHTQRLRDTRLVENRAYLEPHKHYVRVRNYCKRNQKSNKFIIKKIVKALNSDVFLNPFKPLPPIGGQPAIHGIEPNEEDFLWYLEKRVGHTGIFGATRVGKTRLAEWLIAHDIRAGAKKLRGKNGNIGNVVLIFDPKGDGELLRRVVLECIKSGRLDELYMINLGFPEASYSYNPIGDYQTVTEVAGRSTNQLADGGNSSAFKEFSWRFVNINAQALEFIGEEVSFELLSHYISYTDELLEKYLKKKLNLDDESWSDQVAEYQDDLDKAKLMRSGRNERTLAIIECAKDVLQDSSNEGDTILKGLVSALEYDKTYYDKLVASLLPFLDKMTTGKFRELLSPKSNKKRFRWRDVISRRGVVYFGLDALTDPVVAGAFASSAISDLISLTGAIYKSNSVTDEPDLMNGKKVPILGHFDEFNELVTGDEIIQMLNKSGGAALMAHLYTQTMRDIEAKIGDTAKAAQIIGNLQNVIMMRVREVSTAKLLTEQVPMVEVSSITDVGGTKDDGSITQFQTDNSDRRTTKEVPMIEDSDIIGLPVGQAFMLNDGGNLTKLRFPMIEDDEDIQLPSNIDSLVRKMQENYRTGENWSRNG
ncbi:MAG: conjugative coupling factor TraD, PFGI-1 class [Pseudoalteromonas sp.]|nr:conjugative coupling factor TraD, PFGI-1 class [Pseudoalteromonas sp.]|tara:strand:- start:48028 stop:50112 length:2085 start_codon:yes stop_codon:yes gene_type:complete